MSEKPTEKIESGADDTSTNKSRLDSVKSLKAPRLTKKRAMVGIVVFGAIAAALTMQFLRPAGLSLSSVRKIPVLQAFLSKSQNDRAIQSDVKSVFTNNEPGELISSETALGNVGRNPVDPTRILIATFGRSGAPSLDLGSETVSESREPQVASEGPKTDKSGATPASSVEAKAERKQESTESGKEATEQDETAYKPDRPAEKPKSAKKEENKAVAAAAHRRKTTKAVTAPPVVTGITVTPRSKETGLEQPSPGAEERKDGKKPESYRVPGSLVVDLKHYKGKFSAWGLMIILDDSAFMGKKSKSWTSTRMDAATKFVSGLSKVVTPGSKIAVRDFYCNKEKRGGRGAKRCLSRLLLNWSSSPFSELKGKLNDVTTMGLNHPCAAIAYAVKKDMLDLGKLSPRVLIVTGGTSRCPYERVLKALRSAKAGRHVHVDVVGVGMARKNKGAYSRLSQRTQGTFLNLDKPTEIKKALGSYKKALHVRNKREIEIRGQKAVTYGAVGSEITLAPGTYTVKLPEMPGVSEAKRTLPKVRIESGKNRRLKVYVKKGRVVVRGLN